MHLLAMHDGRPNKKTLSSQTSRVSIYRASRVKRLHTRQQRHLSQIKVGTAAALLEQLRPSPEVAGSNSRCSFPKMAAGSPLSDSDPTCLARQSQMQRHRVLHTPPEYTSIQLEKPRIKPEAPPTMIPTATALESLRKPRIKYGLSPRHKVHSNQSNSRPKSPSRRQKHYRRPGSPRLVLEVPRVRPVSPRVLVQEPSTRTYVAYNPRAGLQKEERRQMQKTHQQQVKLKRRNKKLATLAKRRWETQKWIGEHVREQTNGIDPLLFFSLVQPTQPPILLSSN